MRIHCQQLSWESQNLSKLRTTPSLTMSYFDSYNLCERKVFLILYFTCPHCFQNLARAEFLFSPRSDQSWILGCSVSLIIRVDDGGVGWGLPLATTKLCNKTGQLLLRAGGGRQMVCLLFLIPHQAEFVFLQLSNHMINISNPDTFENDKRSHY